MHLGLIEVEHNGIRAFVSIGYIGHKGRINRVAPVRAGRVVEIDYIEGRHLFVAVLIVQQMVVGYFAKVGKFEVVHVHREALFDLLFDELVYDGVRFSGAGSAQYGAGPERVYDVYPAVVPFFLIVEPGRQIDGIFIFNQAGFLLERFVFDVEYVVHHAVL